MQNEKLFSEAAKQFRWLEIEKDKRAVLDFVLVCFFFTWNLNFTFNLKYTASVENESMVHVLKWIEKENQKGKTHLTVLLTCFKLCKQIPSNVPYLQQTLLWQ